MIVDLHRRGAPMFGTCAGMIVLASSAVDGRADQRYLGLIDIDVRRNAYGRQASSFEASLRITGEDLPMHGVFIRAPRIRSLGDGVEVLGRLDDEPVLVRDGRFLLASFHPELTDDLRVHEQSATRAYKIPVFELKAYAANG